MNGMKVPRQLALRESFCPERGFQEINPCLIHKISESTLRFTLRLFFFFPSYIFFFFFTLSVLLHFGRADANPNALKHRRKFSCVFITSFSGRRDPTSPSHECVNE